MSLTRQDVKTKSSKLMFLDNDGVLSLLLLRGKPLFEEHLVPDRAQFFSEKLGISIQEAVPVMEGLKKKYGVDSSFVAFCKESGEDFEALKEEFVERAYVPMIPLISRYAKREDELKRLLDAISLRKVILSNTPEKFILAELEVTGLRGSIDSVIGLESLGMEAKPQRGAFVKAMTTTNSDQDSIYFDDQAQNLLSANSVGMITVQIGQKTEAPYIDYSYSTLKEALISLFLTRNK